MVRDAEILTVLALCVIVWLAVEFIRHRANLKAIPIRVHVNGTRGKSSVTRLIAAGLRQGEHTVLAKTTGTLARVIMPDTREVAVYRPLGANIREQLRIVRLARHLKADILVVECMALQPMLQWLSEKVFVQATHGVITNARPDHLDVMGPGGEDVAKALCGMMPRGGVCFTAEQHYAPILEHAAKDRQSKLIRIEPSDVTAITPEQLSRFHYYEHAENVALALTVCKTIGVDRERALAGMVACQPDPGALTFLELDFFGRQIVFVNAFAANDPVSSHQIWEVVIRRYPGYRSVAVFNCRSDRADRSRQLGAALCEWTPPDRVVTLGDGTRFLGAAAAKTSFELSRIINMEGLSAPQAFERLVELCGEKTVLIGLGNIGGLGLELVRLFRNRSNYRPRSAV